MAYKFKEFICKNVPTVIDLLDNSFTIENKDKEAVITWKYFDSFLKNRTISYNALDSQNIVVSHYANIPFTTIYKTQLFYSLICTDMCTSPTHRGNGLISQLAKLVYRDVNKNKHDFSLGFSNDSGVKVDRYANNYGYEIVGKMVRYFKVVIYRKNISYRLERASEIHKEFLNLTSSYIKVRKDREYLNWRYMKKPNSEYDIYAIGHGEKTLGYVVLRFIGFKCYVYDIVTNTDDKRHMIAVLRSIENKALDHHVRLIIYSVLDNMYWKNLFNRYKYYKKEKNTVNYYVTIKIHRDTISRDLILNKEKWLLMNGDIL